MSDEFSGRAKEFGGKVESTVGNLTGDTKTEAQGTLREAAGRIQANAGAAADQIRGFSEELTERIHESPLLAVFTAVGIGYLLGRITAR